MAKVKKATKDQIPTEAEFPAWTHASNLFYESEWRLLRDTLLGEKQMKSRATDYLPQVSAFDEATEYAAYVDRASFYNMVSRTVTGMLGTLFRRNPIVSGLPAALDLQSVGYGGESIWHLMRQAGQELIHVGRLGGLVDMGKDGGKPYIVTYPVESIVDWAYGIVNGQRVVNYVCLRESKEYRVKGKATVYRTEFRELHLDESGYYQMQYVSTKDKDADITKNGTRINPANRGVPLDFIPFVFMNTSSISADVEKPYLLDVARINLSHFRSSAALEHGRFYTGLPVYTVKGTMDEQTDYQLASSVAWKLPADGGASILEFNGHGLRSLESALTQKETQAASLGGRLIGVTSQSTAESDNMTAMKEKNENAVLLSIAFTLDLGFTKLLQWCAAWQDIPAAQVDGLEVECSKDFMFKPVGAREFRAMHMLYTDGIIPVEIVYDYLKRAEVIPDWLDMDDFKKLLASTKSFPGQPNADARMKGFPNMQSMLDYELETDTLELDQQIADDTKDTADKARIQAEKQAALQRQSTERAAREAARIQPGAGDPPANRIGQPPRGPAR